MARGHCMCWMTRSGKRIHCERLEPEPHDGGSTQLAGGLGGGNGQFAQFAVCGGGLTNTVWVTNLGPRTATG